MNTVLFIAIK